jgi:NADH dehydrogenase
MTLRAKDPHHVVIVGGGFGGLYAAKHLGRATVDVTLVDRRNYHLFQPLLYQVATGGISPGDIASPLRAVLKRNRNTRVWQADVIDIDTGRREVVLRDGRLPYDTLIVATGVRHAYFGNDRWEKAAPGLKTVEDALDVRHRIFLAFEAAEREPSPETRRAWMTFAVIGGGPTGVELAGALGELARGTLKNDFRSIDPRETRIILIEALDRLLPTYPPDLSARAETAVSRLGVTVMTRTRVTDIAGSRVAIQREGHEETVTARTVVWAAGVEASPMGRILARETGASLDRARRVAVEPDLTIKGHPEIFVIGDLASVSPPLPGTAPVAIQQGRHAADCIRRRRSGRQTTAFRFRNRGQLAVIGRHAAVADFGRFHVSGFPAWLAWVFVHIWHLIEFDNKVIVMVQWAADYFTRKRGARLITGRDPHPIVGVDPDKDA